MGSMTTYADTLSTHLRAGHRDTHLQPQDEGWVGDGAKKIPGSHWPTCLVNWWAQGSARNFVSKSKMSSQGRDLKRKTYDINLWPPHIHPQVLACTNAYKLKIYIWCHFNFWSFTTSKFNLCYSEPSWKCILLLAFYNVIIILWAFVFSFY